LVFNIYTENPSPWLWRSGWSDHFKRLRYTTLNPVIGKIFSNTVYHDTSLLLRKRGRERPVFHWKKTI